VTKPPPDHAAELPPFARRAGGGLRIDVKVVPGASRPGIAGILGKRLKVRVAEAPERGKANAAVERLVAAWLGARDARVVAGHGRPEKIVEVEGVTEIPPAALASALGGRG
jgi:uncharacterized protein YggU (UPF0235/DUF167 family)